MELKILLQQIDALKNEIEKLRPINPELEQKIMQKFRLDWNFHSNNIEGNELTFGETPKIMNLYGIIGYPLGHSFSVRYFTEKFVRENRTDCVYHNFPIEDISLFPELITQYPNLKGLSVTIPYKEQIIPYLTHLHLDAQNVGAVNCVKIVRRNGQIQLIGYNTDIYGFRQSLEPHLNATHQNALIFGTGGAAKAVAYTLQQLTVAYSMVSRNPQNKLQIHYSQLNEEIFSKNNLLVQTTPLGMYPHVQQTLPFNKNWINQNHLLFDLIYNPPQTLFLENGKKQGATTLNGLEMLHLQAEKSWEIWNENFFEKK